MTHFTLPNPPINSFLGSSFHFMSFGIPPFYLMGFSIEQGEHPFIYEYISYLPFSQEDSPLSKVSFALSLSLVILQFLLVDFSTDQGQLSFIRVSCILPFSLEDFFGD
jgi:hypothetical protein